MHEWGECLTYSGDSKNSPWLCCSSHYCIVFLPQELLLHGVSAPSCCCKGNSTRAAFATRTQMLWGWAAILSPLLNWHLVLMPCLCTLGYATAYTRDAFIAVKEGQVTSNDFCSVKLSLICKASSNEILLKFL